MADQEITSFIGKFKYLSAAGFKATLEFKSDQHGSVSISLTSEVGSVTPLSNQPPPPPFHRRGRYFRGPSYGRRQLRRRATQESNSREQIATHDSNNADDSDANRSVFLNSQAEKLATVPSLNEDNQPAVDLEVLSCEIAPNQKEKDGENEKIVPSAAIAVSKSCVQSTTDVPHTLANSSKAAATEDFIIARIQTYASNFANPAYLYPGYEPTCCNHHHVPGRGGHNVPKDGSQCCYHRCRRNPHYLTKKPNS